MCTRDGRPIFLRSAWCLDQLGSLVPRPQLIKMCVSLRRLAYVLLLCVTSPPSAVAGGGWNEARHSFHHVSELQPPQHATAGTLRILFLDFRLLVVDYWGWGCHWVRKAVRDRSRRHEERARHEQAHRQPEVVRLRRHEHQATKRAYAASVGRRSA